MTLSQEYFDRLYEAEPDPWQFRSRPYEARKRAVTLASLPDEHYVSAFEPGCSIGILTAALALRCDRLLSMDISPVALAQAAGAVPANVELRQGAVPEDWPTNRFDLVVLSEVGYYLDGPGCRRLGELAAATARDFLAVHWRHPVADYPLPGDEVHRLLAGEAARAGMAHLVNHREGDLRLDVWSHDPRSVASRTGLTDR